jgi:hypothetical protein
MPTATLSDDGRWAVGRLDKPYRMQISWGGGTADYYRVNTATGERTSIVKGSPARSVSLLTASGSVPKHRELWA